MKKTRVIRKVIILAAWFFILAGMTTLLIAANRKQEEALCSKVVITVKGAGDVFYIDEADILSQLQKRHGKLVNRPVDQIQLGALERTLQNNQWVRKAELYFDRENVLHVFAEEREPIARVFAVNGTTFYMDSSGHRMPLLEKMSIRVPVITGFMLPGKNARDSAYMADVKRIAWFVYSNPFWNAQTGQIDITADRKFELMPVVGNHTIRVGNAENLEAKLNRVALFYKQVMSKVGFHKYAVVDAQYAGQIVAVHKGPASPVDSLQLQKNIGELLQRSSIRHLTEDMLPIANTKDSVAVATVKNVIANSNPTPVKDSVTQVVPVRQEKPIQAPPKQSVSANPIPKRTETKPAAKKPKAVMRPSPNNRH